MPKQRRNFRPITGFPGAQWFNEVCGYCSGNAGSWWKCPGKSNHSQTVRCQLLPPIGEVVPVPFDGDFSVIEEWGKSRDGHPEHCGVPSMLMPDSRPWFQIYRGPVWYCPECEAVSLTSRGFMCTPRGDYVRSWRTTPPKDEDRNSITFKETP